MNRIAAYIRVSTDDQSVEMQRAEITRWLEHQGHDLKQVRWYEDNVSGKTLKRPGLMRLRQALSKGAIDMVVVWKLDRLARSFRDGLQLIAHWVQQGIRIVSVTQQLDLTGVVGQMLAGILFALAEIELAHIHERQAAGIALAKAKGKYKGGKPGRSKGNPARARELKAKGLNEKEIAATMHISERSVFRYLKRA